MRGLATFLDDLLAPLLKAPDWVEELALTDHLGRPMTGSWDLVGLAVCGLILRFGSGAESFAWATVFGFAPISGIYYPVSTLPWWLQPVAWMTPAAYVFEGMRAVLFDGVFRWDLMASAVALDILYKRVCE